jgi:hypothetical protein
MQGRAHDRNRAIAITPPRPGRTPLAVDSDLPAASAGTLPSGPTRKRDVAAAKQHRDDRNVARLSEKEYLRACRAGNEQATCGELRQLARECDLLACRLDPILSGSELVQRQRIAERSPHRAN